MFQDPEQILGQLAPLEGYVIADHGAGSGGHALAAGRRVGQFGRVYAIDVRDDLLSALSSRAQREGMAHIEPVRGDVERPYGTRLSDASVDMVLIANTLFQVEDLGGAFRESKRVLKPNGYLLVTDWAGSFGGLGPSSDMVVPAHKARDAAEAYGFLPERTLDAGEYHYGFLARRPEERQR